MNTGFDAYSFLARILPGYITATPILLLVLLAPYGVSLSFASAAFLFPIIYFISHQIGGECGKRKEVAMWEKWDGPPTTRFLRHSNEEFDSDIRGMVHARLRKIGLYVPSAEEEEADSNGADSAYGRCTYMLRALTRQADQFPLVFRSLASYGFYRNLFGLRLLGIASALVSVAVCIAYGVVQPLSTEGVISLSVVGAADIVLLGIWVFRLGERTVKRAAEEYARFLLEAALTLDKPA